KTRSVGVDTQTLFHRSVAMPALSSEGFPFSLISHSHRSFRPPLQRLRSPTLRLAVVSNREVKLTALESTSVVSKGSRFDCECPPAVSTLPIANAHRSSAAFLLKSEQ